MQMKVQMKMLAVFEKVEGGVKRDLSAAHPSSLLLNSDSLKSAPRHLRKLFLPFHLCSSTDVPEGQRDFRFSGGEWDGQMMFEAVAVHYPTVDVEFECTKSSSTPAQVGMDHSLYMVSLDI